MRGEGICRADAHAAIAAHAFNSTNLPFILYHPGYGNTHIADGGIGMNGKIQARTLHISCLLPAFHEFKKPMHTCSVIEIIKLTAADSWAMYM